MCVINSIYLFIRRVHAEWHLEMEEDKTLDGKHAIEEAMSMYSFGIVQLVWLN